VQGSRFNQLSVYRQAVALSDEVWERVARWDSFARWSIGLQLVRAVDSIAANIAEAYGRSTGPDQSRLLVIARGSAYETECWVERALARGLLDEGVTGAVAEITKMLNGLIRSQRR